MDTGAARSEDPLRGQGFFNQGPSGPGPDPGPGAGPPLGHNGFMAIETGLHLNKRLAGMAAEIRQVIPAAEVRLFGSWARGDARPESDVDLLITAPDDWLGQRDRFALLGELWGAVAQPDLSVDLVLHSRSEAARRGQEPGSLVYEAIRDGVLLDS